MKTNIKQVKESVQKYILDCIDSSSYDIETTTEEEKIKFIIECFNNEYVFPNNMRYYKTEENLFINWVMGLPSVFNIDFEYHKISEIMTSFGLPCPDDKDYAQESDLFFSLIYREFRALADKYKLKIVDTRKLTT